MPISKCPQKSEALWKVWDQKAQKNGLKHQVYAVNGDHYVGEWKDNMKHGKGRQIWKKKGAIYEGDWKLGKRDGYGTLSLLDQETGKHRRVYSGWWKGDKKSGYGIQFFGPKEYYEGEWCGNQRNGWGRMYYSNGDIFEGQWRNDKPEGEGMLRLKNGNRYEGYWQRGLKNGSGRFFHLDHGQLFEGFWVDDIAKCGTMIDFGRDEAPEPTRFPIPETLMAYWRKPWPCSRRKRNKKTDTRLPELQEKVKPTSSTAQTGAAPTGGVSGDSGHTLGTSSSQHWIILCQ
uniref:MORN repeat-containing protein 3 n=1 Tax=Molossus molossus TaxID=27622 RepID=A0A7J8BYR7_MOLMO|nr:MORN repeat containing 3 [Molossus molossus]